MVENSTIAVFFRHQLRPLSEIYYHKQITLTIHTALFVLRVRSAMMNITVLVSVCLFFSDTRMYQQHQYDKGQNCISL